MAIILVPAALIQIYIRRKHILINFCSQFLFKGVFTWVNSHQRAFHTGMTRVYMMTGSFHISLFEGTLHDDKIHLWFKIANVTNALPVPVYRQTDFKPKRVVDSRLPDTVARFRTEVKFSPGTTTVVNSRRGDSHQHDILWWYPVNKYRVMRGNRSELARGGKSPLRHVNSP